MARSGSDVAIQKKAKSLKAAFFIVKNWMATQSLSFARHDDWDVFNL
jgi:hypothetical protein